MKYGNGIAPSDTGAPHGNPHFATLRPMESGTAQYILKHTFGYDSFRGGSINLIQIAAMAGVPGLR